MSDMTMLRIWILVAGVALVAAILIFGRPKKAGQGRRVARTDESRAEPTLGQQLEAERLPCHRLRDARDQVGQVLDLVVDRHHDGDIGRRQVGAGHETGGREAGRIMPAIVPVPRPEPPAAPLQPLS